MTAMERAVTIDAFTDTTFELIEHMLVTSGRQLRFEQVIPVVARHMVRTLLPIAIQYKIVNGTLDRMLCNPSIRMKVGLVAQETLKELLG